MCDFVENVEEVIMEGEMTRGDSWGTSALEKGPGGGDSSFPCCWSRRGELWEEGGDEEDRCFGGGDVRTGLEMTG